MIIELDNFILKEFDLNNEDDLILLDKIIKSTNSELFCKDIKQYILNNINRRKKDGITNSYVCLKDNNAIGLAMVNYHPKENDYSEEIEIGLILIDSARGEGNASLIEKELSGKLLNMYPRFNKIVARIEYDNIASIKSIEKAGFIYNCSNETYNYNEYIFSRK